jgi:hypothetical protein
MCRESHAFAPPTDSGIGGADRSGGSPRAPASEAAAVRNQLSMAARWPVERARFPVSSRMGFGYHLHLMKRTSFYKPTCEGPKAGVVKDLDIVLGCSEPTQN